MHNESLASTFRFLPVSFLADKNALLLLFADFLPLRAERRTQLL